MNEWPWSEQEARQLHGSLMNRTTLRDEEPAHAVGLIGLLVDTSCFLESPAGTGTAIALADDLRGSGRLGPAELATLDYFVANAWADLRKRRSSLAEQWEWLQPEMQEEVVALRRAIEHGADGAVPALRMAQMRTNLGNAYNTAGRILAALREWAAAIRCQPGFPMALGNYAVGLREYGARVPEGPMRQAIARHAVKAIESALSAARLEPGARAGFSELVRGLSDYLSRCPPAPSIDTGVPNDLYARWCALLRLYLNPLNDISQDTDGAGDSAVRLYHKERSFLGDIFDRMVTEYLAARRLLWQACTEHQEHREYCMDWGDELARLAFRMAYSILDKTAYYVNHYFDLQIPNHRVTFRTVWYTKADPHKGINAGLVAGRKLSMRGLYWLSRDYFEDDDEFAGVTDPDARQVRDVRNHLEHKCLILSSGSTSPSGGATLVIARTQLFRMTTKLLASAREAILYAYTASAEQDPEPGN